MRLALGLGLPYGSGVEFTPSFHPTQLPGLVALYDISDLSTLFVERTGASASTPASVDGVVGTVLDLSGNGYHLTAPSDAARPRLRSGEGLYWLEMDGVDDKFAHSIDGKACFAAAVRFASGQSGYKGIIATGAADVTGSMLLANLVTDEVWGTYGGQNYPAGTDISDDADHVLVMDGINSGTYWLDGVSDGTWDATHGQADKHVGGQTSGVQFFSGRIYAVMACSSAFGEKRGDVQTWLAAKQGRVL